MAIIINRRVALIKLKKGSAYFIMPLALTQEVESILNGVERHINI